MQQLFEAISFGNKPFIWSYSSREMSPAEGFYHWHQCCEILFIHEGNGMVVFNNQTYEIKKGMLFFFQPFELHKVFSNQSSNKIYDRTVIHLDHVLIEQFLKPFPYRQKIFKHLLHKVSGVRAFDLSTNFDQVSGFLKFFDQSYKARIGESNEEITILVLLLLSAIRSTSVDLDVNNQAQLRNALYSEKIMQWLEERFHEEFKLEELANDIHLSKFYVSRIFKQETGSSITEYLTARRIKQACYLLETTNFPIEQIGGKVGMPNTSHFIQIFKKVVGMTPLKYKQAL